MPVAVGVAPVRKMDAPLQLSALGTVTSTYTVTLQSRVAGELKQVHFSEGQLVKKGQLLFSLDERPYVAALDQAKGQLLHDQALLDNARIDLQRYQQLVAQNSLAKQQLDTQAALVKQYQGTVTMDKGTLEAAQANVDYTRITSPIDGRIGLRLVDPGNIVQTSSTTGMAVITQTQPINVVFAIPEGSLSQLLQASGADRKLAVEAWDRDNKNKLADGKLLALDSQLNTSTGTINIKASFANEKQQLFPNQFVNVNLQLGVREHAIVVPSVAIQLGKVGHYVYTLNQDSTVSVSKVEVGPVSGDNTIIESGVHPGQRVVIDGVDKLRNGAKVKVVDRAAQSKGGDMAGGGWKGKHNASGAWGKHQASAAN